MQDIDLNEDMGNDNITMPTMCDLFDIARHRFGFSWSVSIPHHQARTIGIDIRTVYGCNTPNDDDMTLAPMRSFFSSLVAHQVPTILCDLMPECPGTLGSQELNAIKIRRVVLVDRHIVSAETVWYEVDSNPNLNLARPRWLLFVKTAESALECIRRKWGPRVEDVARSLLEKGIPFTTRVSLLRPLEEPLPPPINLGWRYRTYAPDHLDYKAYERRRNTLLSQPRGRVALLTGGIVWRLAMEVLSPDMVLVGPTPGEYGNYVSSRDDHRILWDEELTDGERDLVCGVYHVPGELATTFFYS
jgi:hypothetical protein